MSEYRWNEPGIQAVHAVLCTSQDQDPTRLAEQVIDFLLKAGWTPPPPMTIFSEEYHGFEDAVDVFRDVSEAFDSSFNPNMKSIPGEFQGTMKVTITYTPSEDDPKGE